MLNRRRDETDRPPRHDPSDAMPDSRQFPHSVFDGWNFHMDTRRISSCYVWMGEEILMEHPAVEGQRPKHAWNERKSAQWLQPS